MVEGIAGIGLLVALSATEQALGDFLFEQRAVGFHHPVDMDLVAAAVELIGEAQIADDSPFVGTTGEDKEGEDGGGGHGVGIGTWNVGGDKGGVCDGPGIREQRHILM